MATFIKNDNIIYFINHANSAFAPIQCANVVVGTGNLLDTISKTVYSGKELTASDSLSWLDQGIYKIFDAIPIGYPPGIDPYKYGVLTVTAAGDYVAYQLFAVNAAADSMVHKVGFCHIADRSKILWMA